MNLRASWDAAAQDWIRWARSPTHDHHFWGFNLPAMLALLPEPGRLTVDVGCGEGRVARELVARGHRVVGIEGSPALAEAARESGLEVHLADAAAMPLADGSADLAVASMSLLNFDDMPGAVRAVARVLEPGGRFVFNTPHPLVSAKPLGDDPRAGDYFAEYAYVESRERDGLRMDFHDVHRPLSAYLGTLEAAGLLVESVREPRPDDAYVARVPGAEKWQRTPLILLVRALKP